MVIEIFYWQKYQNNTEMLLTYNEKNETLDIIVDIKLQYCDYIDMFGNVK